MSQHTDGGEPRSNLTDAEKCLLVAYRMAKRKRLALTEATLLEQAELRKVDAERKLWVRDLEVANSSRGSKPKENHDLWYARCEEARFCLENYDAGLMRRYLYLAAG